MKLRTMLLLAGMTASAAVCAQQSLVAGKNAVVANEGKIGDRWMLAEGASLATPAYPAALAARGDDACVALGYMINPDGSTSDFTVLRQWNSALGEDEPQPGYWQAFAESGAEAVSQWKFQPRPGVAVARPTFTVATLGFKGKGQGDGSSANCRIADLAALIQARKSHDYMNHSRERADLDRANRASRAAGALVSNPGIGRK